MRDRLARSAAAASPSPTPAPTPVAAKDEGHPVLWTLAILALVGGIGYLIYRLTRRETVLASGYGSVPAFTPAAPMGSYGYGAPTGSAVIVNNGGGSSNLLSTMIMADAIRHNHHHSHDTSPSHSAPSSSSSYASAAPAPSSSFDLGAGGSS